MSIRTLHPSFGQELGSIVHPASSSWLISLITAPLIVAASDTKSDTSRNARAQVLAASEQELLIGFGTDSSEAVALLYHRKASVGAPYVDPWAAQLCSWVHVSVARYRRTYIKVSPPPSSRRPVTIPPEASAAAVLHGQQHALSGME